MFVTAARAASAAPSWWLLSRPVATWPKSDRAAADSVLSWAADEVPQATCRAYALDVTDAQAVERVGDRVLDDFDRVDAVVCNAGRVEHAVAAQMSDATWSVVLETNLHGSFYVARHFLMPFLAQRHGRLVFVGSIAQHGMSGQVNYSASKAGLVGLAKALAKEYGARNITANVVVPGFFDTDMTRTDMRTRAGRLLRSRRPRRHALLLGLWREHGTISALLRRHHHVVMDRSSHMSILEGAQLSRAHLHYLAHNDPADLDAVLRDVAGKTNRVLVCTEGVFSADGDLGRLREVVAVAKRHGALVLVDEAHSFLVAGPHGRGVCEEAGVLDDVDLYVLTFSKGLGVGGALVAHSDIARYVGWYARCQMFSCAIGPAVTGGVLRALELGRGDDGDARRRRIRENAAACATSSPAPWISATARAGSCP